MAGDALRPTTLEMRDLRLVEAIARLGTLALASTEICLTNSALSHQLSSLERRLGFSLFRRSGKRMVPTPAGEELQQSARQALDLVAGVEERLREAARGRTEVLRLSTECYTCYHWLPKLLQTYRQTHDSVEVRIVAEATGRTVPALLAGELDLAIISCDVNDRRLKSTPLFEDEFVAVVSPRHAWARRPYVTAADFADQNLIVYDTPRSESSVFVELLDPARIAPRRISTIQLTEAILEMVQADLGVSVLARWAVTPLVTRGSLVAVPITRTGMRRDWFAAVPKFRETPKFVEDFIRLLRRAKPTSVPVTAGRRHLRAS